MGGLDCWEGEREGGQWWWWCVCVRACEPGPALPRVPRIRCWVFSISWMNPVRPSASGALDSPQPQLQLVRWRSHARQVRPARQVRQVRHAPPLLCFAAQVAPRLIFHVLLVSLVPSLLIFNVSLVSLVKRRECSLTRTFFF